MDHHRDRHKPHGTQDAPSSTRSPQPCVTPESKLLRMLEHWLHHNEDHARAFRDWADRARELGLGEVGGLLEEVARLSGMQSEHLEKAMRLLQHPGN